MDSGLETIRIALADGASVEQRAAGVTACRAVITALGAAQGQPTAGAAVAPGLPLAGLSFDQVLELAIAKLRSMLPAEQGTSSPPGEAPLTIRMFKREP